MVVVLQDTLLFVGDVLRSSAPWLDDVGCHIPVGSVLRVRSTLRNYLESYGHELEPDTVSNATALGSRRMVCTSISMLQTSITHLVELHRHVQGIDRSKSTMVSWRWDARLAGMYRMSWCRSSYAGLVTGCYALRTIIILINHDQNLIPLASESEQPCENASWAETVRHVSSRHWRTTVRGTMFERHRTGS